MLAVALAVSVSAQNISLPSTPSPAATVMQKVGISTIQVEYSRPSVRDRVVWGDLVPYGWNVQGFGNQKLAPWRAGANKNTVIEFSHEAKVAGQTVPAGRYGLFFVINKDDSGEVILSKDSRSWGSFFYEASRDQLRAKIQLRNIPMTEMLTYDFINLTKNSAELVLNWEKKQFPVPIEFAVDDIVLANAEEELKGPTGFSWQGFASAANYTMQNKVQQEKGLKWAETAVAQNKSFNNLMLKSNLLKQLGKHAEAEKAATEALSLGNETDLNLYGYQLANEGRFDDAIRIMKLGTERYPESANTWDSLGEIYALKGDKENAIKYFKKSLSMNPPENVRANSIKYLKQFGEKVPEN